MKKATTSATKDSVKSLYPATKLTKTSNKNLWVAFPAGSPELGLVYPSTLSRDTVRRAAGKVLNYSKEDMCSRRVSNFSM